MGHVACWIKPGFWTHRIHVWYIYQYTLVVFLVFMQVNIPAPWILYGKDYRKNHPLTSTSQTSRIEMSQRVVKWFVGGLRKWTKRRAVGRVFYSELLKWIEDRDSTGCFLQWWYPQNTPKCFILLVNPWLLGTTILGNPQLAPIDKGVG